MATTPIVYKGMTATPVAYESHENARRCERGELAIAFDIEINGKKGKAFYYYEWDKRDIEGEGFYTEANIAADVLAIMPEEGPASIFMGKIGTSDDSFGTKATLNEYQEAATEELYDY